MIILLTEKLKLSPVLEADSTEANEDFEMILDFKTYQARLVEKHAYIFF